MDPRAGIIEERLRGKRIIGVAGGKGGVGKSVISTLMALNLSSMGYRVGLLDLDFSGPSDHIILGINCNKFPKEEKGIIPPEVYGIKFFSIVYYAGDNPTPLRGIDITNAIKEILAVVVWKDVDTLIIDMPPGMGEEILDSSELIRGLEFLAVTTPSKVSINTAKKFIELLKDMKLPFFGVIENMRIKKTVKEVFGQNFLGSIKFDLDLEEAIGNPDKLMRTNFSRELREILERKFRVFP